MSFSRSKSPTPPTPIERNILSKEAFLQQYVLNRALANDGTMDGEGSAMEALKAWEIIRGNK